MEMGRSWLCTPDYPEADYEIRKWWKWWKWCKQEWGYSRLKELEGSQDSDLACQYRCGAIAMAVESLSRVTKWDRLLISWRNRAR